MQSRFPLVVLMAQGNQGVFVAKAGSFGYVVEFHLAFTSAMPSPHYAFEGGEVVTPFGSSVHQNGVSMSSSRIGPGLRFT